MSNSEVMSDIFLKENRNGYLFFPRFKQLPDFQLNVHKKIICTLQCLELLLTSQYMQIIILLFNW